MKAKLLGVVTAVPFAAPAFADDVTIPVTGTALTVWR
jgi:opacity protein-like surface antigen